jgi:probable HAF family extracellular repeat protein
VEQSLPDARLAIAEQINPGAVEQRSTEKYKERNMNCKTWTRIIALALFAVLAIPVQLAAQDRTQPQHQYHHYQLIDSGTFGGPQSWLWVPGLLRPGVINNQGTLVGYAETLAVDPYCFWTPDCYAPHAFQWRNGVTTDLGVLPGGIGSQVSWISGNGLMAGVSDNGQQDPLNPAFPQLHAVLWDHGQMTDLGTLPEGGYSSGSWVATVNNRGEVVGQAYNTIPDPNSLFGYGYQSRAFYWKNGVMQDLGTLGTGTDAMAGLINDRGQVVGWSYTSSVPSARCAPLLTTGSFLWDRKNGMKDIGGLGGTCTLAYDLNDHGQIVGGSSLTGDTQFHPFVWEAATGVTDLLGASNGNWGNAFSISSSGVVVGGTSDSVTIYASLWRKSGGHWHKTSLSTSSQSAFAVSINASEQVVGNWFGTGAFLSEDGGPIVDLNTLVPPGSGLQLVEAGQINDLGEIAVSAAPDANGHNHAVLLIPCDGNHPGVEGCDYSLVEASAVVAKTTPAVRNTSSRTLPSTMRRMNRYRIPGLGAPRPE